MKIPNSYPELYELITTTALSSGEILAIAESHLDCEDCEVCDYALDEGEEQITVLLIDEQINNMDAQTMKFMFDNMESIAGLGPYERGHSLRVDLALHPNSGPEPISEAGENFGWLAVSWEDSEVALTAEDFAETLRKVANHAHANDEIVQDWALSVHCHSLICDEVVFEDCETCDLALQQSTGSGIPKRSEIVRSLSVDDKPKGPLARLFGKRG